MNDFLLLLVQAAWKLKKSYQKVGKIAHDARQLQNHRKVRSHEDLQIFRTKHRLTVPLLDEFL